MRAKAVRHLTDEQGDGPCRYPVKTSKYIEDALPEKEVAQFITEQLPSSPSSGPTSPLGARKSKATVESRMDDGVLQHISTLLASGCSIQLACNEVRMQRCFSPLSEAGPWLGSVVMRRLFRLGLRAQHFTAGWIASAVCNQTSRGGPTCRRVIECSFNDSAPMRARDRLLLSPFSHIRFTFFQVCRSNHVLPHKKRDGRLSSGHIQPNQIACCRR
jgi:hypothetical protein